MSKLPLSLPLSLKFLSEANRAQYASAATRNSEASRNGCTKSTSENHCALVNFPLVSSRAGRMDAFHPEYASIRGRKRARREREMCSHTPYLQIHVPEHTHSRATYPEPRRENSTGRFICMLVFFRTLGSSHLSDSTDDTSL